MNNQHERFEKWWDGRAYDVAHKDYCEIAFYAGRVDSLSESQTAQDAACKERDDRIAALLFAVRANQTFNNIGNDLKSFLWDVSEKAATGKTYKPRTDQDKELLEQVAVHYQISADALLNKSEGGEEL